MNDQFSHRDRTCILRPGNFKSVPACDTLVDCMFVNVSVKNILFLVHCHVNFQVKMKSN